MVNISEAQVKSIVEKNLASSFEFVYLLGSAGTERAREDSDVDLAIYWKTTPAFAQLTKFIDSISQDLHCEIDLASLNDADIIFSRQTLETGRLLLCVSPGKHLQWQAEQLSRYPDFKRSREAIEQNILKRKKYV